MKKLKEKWGITSNFQLLIIFLVFSVTGSLSLWVAKPLLDFIGLDKATLSPWIFWPIRILIIFPIYQILIVIIGALFGQFQFFWNFEKKIWVVWGSAQRWGGWFFLYKSIRENQWKTVVFRVSFDFGRTS